MFTLDCIKSRCDATAGCWIWTGATTDNGYPIANKKGVGCQLVRRVAYELSGKTLYTRVPIVATCANKLCVNPKHLVRSTVKKVAIEASETGYHARIDRRLKISKFKRAAEGGAKLTQSQADEIRSSKESSPILSKRYGVHRSLINKIKAGLVWKDYTNPFQQLMG